MNLPVAAVLSIGFNVIVLVLWYTDFGSAPVELDGRIADRRLRRARQLARTGTFVARIDDEVFRDMTREQLEGVAERAWRRAHAADEESAEPATSGSGSAPATSRRCAAPSSLGCRSTRSSGVPAP